MPPAASLALSASASIRCLYSAVKLRRLALATTSGLGRSAIPRSPTVALRSSSLRSASLRSTDMAGEDVFVFFMLNFLPVLLCNQWYEKCLSYIGTEGRRPASQRCGICSDVPADGECDQQRECSTCRRGPPNRRDTERSQFCSGCAHRAGFVCQRVRFGFWIKGSIEWVSRH